VLSQTKSLVQSLSGDLEGARGTQLRFTRTCPLVAQCRSLGELLWGYSEEAQETQCESLSTVSQMLNGNPVTGYVKGLVHYLCDDDAGGEDALLSATRSVAVVGAGTLGFLTAGPPGAMIGGACGGVLMDLLLTGGSALRGKYELFGYCALCYNIYNFDVSEKSGPIFDLCVVTFFDAIAGYGGAADLIGNTSMHVALQIANQVPMTDVDATNVLSNEQNPDQNSTNQLAEDEDKSIRNIDNATENGCENELLLENVENEKPTATIGSSSS